MWILDICRPTTDLLDERISISRRGWGSPSLRTWNAHDRAERQESILSSFLCFICSKVGKINWQAVSVCLAHVSVLSSACFISDSTEYI